MRNKTLSRAICALDSIIYDNKANIIKKKICKMIKKYKIRKAINKTMDRELDNKLIIELAHLLSNYGIESGIQIGDNLTITYDVYSVENDQYRVIITDSQTHQKLELNTSMSYTDVVYQNISMRYDCRLDRIKDILQDEVRDFFISSVIHTVELLTSEYKINIAFYNPNMY